MVAGVSLVGFLVAVVGVPLPASRFKPTSRPFPCMNHACGCADADQCWRDCCCFSHEQKLAWAKAHGVQPPGFLLALAEHEHAEHAEEGHEREEHDCCRRHSPEARFATKCSAGARKSSGRSCCHAAQDCHDSSAEPTGAEPTSAAATATEQTGLTFTLVNNFRKCRGLPQLWSVLGASTAPPRAVRYAFHWLVIEWLSIKSTIALSCASPPPTPPPLG